MRSEPSSRPEWPRSRQLPNPGRRAIPAPVPAKSPVEYLGKLSAERTRKRMVSTQPSERADQKGAIRGGGHRLGQ